MQKDKIVLKIGFNAELEIVTRVIDNITERFDRQLEDRIANLLFAPKAEKALDKCGNCAWFHKGAKFCAVAPQNLASFECGDRQVPEVTNLNLDYLEARSPERTRLVWELAEKLGIDADVLEQTLYCGRAKHPENFGTTARGILFEIETYGSYSIAHMGLIGDVIRLHSDYAHPCLVAGAIRKKVFAGQSFEGIMRWLLLPSGK